LLIHIQAEIGGRRNALANPERSKAIIQLSNTDIQCLVKSIILYPGKNNQNKLEEIFKGKLIDAEVTEIYYKLKDTTGINSGIFSYNEITYLRQPTKKLLSTLADAIHRIDGIKIKPQSNDIVDAKSIVSISNKHHSNNLIKFQ
jgi:hypothetical protein